MICNSTRPYFNYPNEEKALYCVSCKLENMVDVKNRKCITCKLNNHILCIHLITNSYILVIAKNVVRLIFYIKNV